MHKRGRKKRSGKSFNHVGCRHTFCQTLRQWVEQFSFQTTPSLTLPKGVTFFYPRIYSKQINLLQQGVSQEEEEEEEDQNDYSNNNSRSRTRSACGRDRRGHGTREPLTRDCSKETVVLLKRSFLFSLFGGDLKYGLPQLGAADAEIKVW